MARQPLAAACVALLLAGAAGAQPSAPAATRASEPAPLVAFSLTGRGWGHGVGMSQYGALGFAQRGHTYDAILAHYYPGTELGPAPVARLRVLVAEGAKAAAIGSDAPFAVTAADGATYELPAGTVRFGPGLSVKVDPERPALKLPGPLVFAAKGAPLELGGKAYRGTLQVLLAKGRLAVVNHVGLEAYLFGVVPREVPATWPPEALKAQAVVARSYALAVRRSGGTFDLYDDVRSQVYGGISAEQSATTAAVLATVGQVVLHEGKVATTFFFSTSGGKTANVEEVWSGDPVPYLVSVPDPYDSLSPHHTWGPLPISAKRLRASLGLRAVPVDARVTLTSSGRADRLVLVLPDGSEAAVAATKARTKLGLRSTWFRLGVLGLRPPKKRVHTFGTKLALGGFARSVGSVALEARLPGKAWQPVAVPEPEADGTFTVRVAPKATTDYRLAGGRTRGAVLRVLVAPRLRLLPPTSPTALSGTARPIAPGAPVLIQRRAGATWATVARVTVDEAGAFSAELDLVGGTYRARMARTGFAVGLSPVLEVVRE